MRARKSVQKASAGADRSRTGLSSGSRNTPILSRAPQQLESVRDALSDGLSRGLARLAPEAATLPVTVREAAVCTLADFPEHAVVGPGDMMASVLVPLGASHAATLVFAQEPESALALLERAGRRADAPLDAYVDCVHALAEAMVGALAAGDLAPGPGRLVEGDLTGTMVGTHAPGDTALFSARWEMSATEGAPSLEGYLYCLLDAKRLDALLNGVAAAEPARSE